MSTYEQRTQLFNSLPNATDLRDLLQMLPTDNEMASLVENVTDQELEKLLEGSLYGRAKAKSFKDHYRSFLGFLGSKAKAS